MPAAPDNQTERLCWWQFAGILLAAVALGYLYNHASPLRVRAAAANPPPSTAKINSPAARPAGLQNEVISLVLETPAPAIAPAKPVAAAPAGQIHIPGRSWADVKAMIDAGKPVVLIDARAKTMFDAGHIPGAISLPAGSSPEALRAFAASQPKNAIFVVYCSSDTCHLSQGLAESLVRLAGLANVSHMPGGYSEYTLATNPK